MDFPGGSDCKESACNAGDLGGEDPLEKEMAMHLVFLPGKSKALTRWAFVGKAMSLLFNMLLGFIITFLPRSKCLFISFIVCIILRKIMFAYF